MVEKRNSLNVAFSLLGTALGANIPGIACNDLAIKTILKSLNPPECISNQLVRRDDSPQVPLGRVFAKKRSGIWALQPCIILSACCNLQPATH